MFLVNGELKSTVSCLDRGLQFGDGLFETIAVRNGEIMHWLEHWRRLSVGCRRLFIPEPDESNLVNEIRSLIKGQNQQVIKLIYTRGESKRGYKFDKMFSQQPFNSGPSRILSCSDWPEFNPDNAVEGIALFECLTRLAHQPLLAGLKHLNRLENVLARNEWQDDIYAEGLMCDVNGLVMEGTMSNLFMVNQGKLYTADLSFCGVAGITRQRILRLANQENIEANICEIKKETLFSADEIFVCNSLIGIWPVKQIADKYFSTKKEDNPITRLMQQSIQHSL